MIATDRPARDVPSGVAASGRWVARFGRPDRSGEAAAGAFGSPPATAWALDAGRPELRLTVDPDDAPPAWAELQGCRLIFDGVLYNRAELTRHLADRATVRSNDAALVLGTYLRWGEAALSRIKGIFALVLWDGRNDTLLGARDPLGVYPLYYAEAGAEHEVLLATSVNGLVRQPGVGRALNRAALADHLCHRWPDVGETYYQQVRRIPPGHVLRVDRAGRRLRRYWDPAPLDAPVRWIRDEELGRFDELIEQAVERFLDLGRAGVFLSGGLDSVSIAAVAADSARRHGRPAPHALSLVFPDPESNEELTQRAVAGNLGLPQTVVRFAEAVGPQGLFAAALELSASLPLPLLNFWLPGYCHLARIGQRQGCQVILTGGGGDEWLGVSPFYAADLLRAGKLSGLRGLAASARRSYRTPRLRVLQDVLWTFGARLLLEAAIHRLLRRAAPGVLVARRRWHVARLTPRWVAPDRALRRELDERALQSAPDPVPGPGGFYVGEMRPALDHPLIAMDMEEIFELGRRLGLRVLQPFWDAEVVDLLYRVPPQLLNRGGRAKGLVRQSLARRFPPLGFERQKKITASTYFRSVALREGAAAWDRAGGAIALADLGIVDPNALAAAVRAIRNGRQVRHAYHMWDVLNLEAWTRPRV